MSLLQRGDWVKLRDIHRVAFTGMPDDLFKSLMDSVFDGSEKRETLDDVDAMLFCLARAEPGITPGPDVLATTSEPGITPGPSDI